MTELTDLLKVTREDTIPDTKFRSDHGLTPQDLGVVNRRLDKFVQQEDATIIDPSEIKTWVGAQEAQLVLYRLGCGLPIVLPESVDSGEMLSYSAVGVPSTHHVMGVNQTTGVTVTDRFEINWENPAEARRVIQEKREEHPDWCPLLLGCPNPYSGKEVEGITVESLIDIVDGLSFTGKKIAELGSQSVNFGYKVQVRRDSKTNGIYVSYIEMRYSIEEKGVVKSSYAFSTRVREASDTPDTWFSVNKYGNNPQFPGQKVLDISFGNDGLPLDVRVFLDNVSTKEDISDRFKSLNAWISTSKKQSLGAGQIVDYLVFPSMKTPDQQLDYAAVLRTMAYAGMNPNEGNLFNMNSISFR